MNKNKTEICGIYNYAKAIKQTDLSENTMDILAEAQAALINTKHNGTMEPFVYDF